jgi:hypothetical protein
MMYLQVRPRARGFIVRPPHARENRRNCLSCNDFSPVVTGGTPAANGPGDRGLRRGSPFGMRTPC